MIRRPRPLWCAILVVVLAALVVASPARAAEKLTVEDVHKSKPDSWYGTPDAKPIIDSILNHQRPAGGWDKQYDLNVPAAQTPVNKDWTGCTIDNRATYTELRILAKAYNASRRADVLDAFNRGLDFLFTMQYPNGGFPQRYPLPNDYGRYITFNDHAMIHALALLDEVARKDEFAFVDPARRAKAKDAFDRGVDCILKLQIKRGDRLTGWGQQYDPETMQPAKARTYELPSIASDETVGLVRLLMRIENPSPEVKRAIRSAVQWLDESKLTGIRLEKKPDASLPKGFDVYVVEDPKAPPLWARFYEIDTNRPFFCGRDGVKKYKLEEIEAERRSGYAWMRPYAEKIPQEYADWAARHGEKAAAGN